MMKKLLVLFSLMLMASWSFAQWIPQASGFTTASRGIQYIHCASATTVWATGYDGSGGGAYINEFTKTDNGGDLWVPGQVLGGNTYGLGNICGIDANTAWVALYNGAGNQDTACGVYKTTDGGLTWVHQQGALQGAASFADNVYFWNATQGMCHGDVKDNYFEVYTTTDGGTTWTRVPMANFSGVAVASGEGGWTGVIETTGTSTVLFGTNKGKVYKSDDYGVTWVASQSGCATTGTTAGVNELAFKDSNHGLAGHVNAGNQLDLYETLNGGTSWAHIVTTDTVYGNSLAYVPGTPNTYVCTGAATGVSGAAFSYDGGHHWTQFNATSGTQFLATDWWDNATGWAGAFNDQTTPAISGGFYKYNDVLTQVAQLNPEKGGIALYPNPTHGQFTITLVGLENQDVNIKVYDFTGSLVYSSMENNSLISYNKSLDLSNLAKGMYIVDVQSGKKSFQQKLNLQ